MTPTLLPKMKAPPPARPLAQHRLADWADGVERSVLRQMIAVVSRPGILSFAGGLPDPALFPTQEYNQALSHVLATDRRALQYGPPFEPLKAHIVSLMARRGVICRPEQVFITTGAQQALNVLATLLLNSGDPVLLESIVYTGMQQIVAPFQPDILAVPTDLEAGIDVAAVADYLEAGHRPGFIYLIPVAHNPLGVSLSQTKRCQMVELAQQYEVPIIEDDAYGFLSYDGPALPPLRALDDQWVFYVGSFSKIMAPALRLGWMVVPESLVMKLTVTKEAVDLETSALTQRAVSAYLDTGQLPAHVERLRRAYRRRRDAMLTALANYFPAGTRWTNPAGGMFIWVELPEQVDTTALLEAAVNREQVAFIPGHAFCLPGHNIRHCLRLSFSNVAPEDISDGIRRLAAVVHDFIP